MTIFQNSLGVWVLHDGSDYRYFQSEQEARVAMAALNVSEQPLEMEFVQAIVGEFLPNLRKLYLAMVAMQVQWQDEEFQAALATAALSETPLAGYPAATWQKWGTALLLLQAFLEAEQATLGGETMRTLLMRRYVAEVAA